jgi:glycosyltransferase involved in cell wall biosynthesis
LKILQIHNSYIYYGGEDSVVNEEAKILKKNGHEVILLLRDNKKELLTLKDKFKTLLNLSYSKDSLKILDQKLLEIGKPDIVHVHNTFPLWSYSIFELLNEKNIPVIMTLHNYRLIWDTLGVWDNNYLNYGCYKNSKIKTLFISRLLNRKKNLLNKIDKFITLTEFTKQKFIEANVPVDKLIIKPNFLSKKIIEIQNIDTKQNAIFASRISKEKGILTLLKAWKNIPIKIKIFGDGHLFKKLKKNNHNVEFYGNCSIDRIGEEIKNSKFLIFPSEWYEPMGMTILEAFRAGTLVLASNIGSIPSIIKDGYNGILFNPGDAIDIQNKIKWILNNSKKCNEIVANAFNDFNQKYSDEINYKSLIKIYEDTINDKNLNIILDK